MGNASFEELYPGLTYKWFFIDSRPEELIWRHNIHEPFNRVVVARYDPDGLEYEYNLFDKFLKS